MHELFCDKGSQADCTIDDWQFSPHSVINVTFPHTWLEKHTSYWVVFVLDFQSEKKKKHTDCSENMTLLITYPLKSVNKYSYEKKTAVISCLNHQFNIGASPILSVWGPVYVWLYKAFCGSRRSSTKSDSITQVMSLDVLQDYKFEIKQKNK